jgi:hypothetical protein
VLCGIHVSAEVVLQLVEGPVLVRRRERVPHTEITCNKVFSRRTDLQY